MNPAQWEKRELRRVRLADEQYDHSVRRFAVTVLAAFLIVMGMIVYTAWLLTP